MSVSFSVVYTVVFYKESLVMAEQLLEIKNLHAGVEDKEILKGLSLSVGKGGSACYLRAEWFRQVHIDERHHGASQVHGDRRFYGVCGRRYDGNEDL